MERRSVSDRPEPKIPRIPHMVCGGELNTHGSFPFREKQQATHNIPGGMPKNRKKRNRVTHVHPFTIPPDRVLFGALALALAPRCGFPGGGRHSALCTRNAKWLPGFGLREPVGTPNERR